MEAHTILPISLNFGYDVSTLPTVMHNPIQSGRLATWAIKLNKYDIMYKPQASAIEQWLADFIIKSVPAFSNLKNQSDKWKLHLDGASLKQASGIRIQLVSPTE